MRKEDFIEFFKTMDKWKIIRWRLKFTLIYFFFVFFCLFEVKLF